jgi:hypothetical protein
VGRKTTTWRFSFSFNGNNEIRNPINDTHTYTVLKYSFRSVITNMATMRDFEVIYLSVAVQPLWTLAAFLVS